MRAVICTLGLVFALSACASLPSSNTHKILVEFPVNTETRAEFIEELHKILVDTRAFDGCLDVSVWTNESDADKVWIYEEWQTREHQAAYVKWRGDTGNTAHLGPYISGPPRFLWLDEHAADSGQ
ncbi:MAG: antibiotic biosynthesis monooxygenase [Planctomycetes bacterium]|nr:antibiotic biosynthesis monooxygenase [Planctomycetota bacterium]